MRLLYQRDENAEKAQVSTPEKVTYTEEVVIPVTRAQIRQEMVERGNELQTRVDFKVTIKLSMSIKPRKHGSKAPDTKPVYWGDMSTEYPPNVKVVRIFTSSTFTDTKYERNFWMEEAYPKIKNFCLSHGYEFQVVDMRWGVRDQATDDHKGTELCLRELEQCQKISTGPNFVSLLSHKYGYTSLPRDIAADEFEQLLTAMSPEQKNRILKWYIRDDNAVPPSYILQSISKLIPDFTSRNTEKRNGAKSEWWDENQAVQEALVSSATQVLGKEGAMKYIISITHLETQKGLLQSVSPERQCLWVKRTIEDIEEIKPSYQLSRFIECLGPDEKWRKSRQLLDNLKNKDIPSVLPSDNILSYKVPWREKGIDPDDPEHYKYLKEMTSDFADVICNRIESAIQERKESEVDSNVYEECLRHMKFCREKANAVSRDDILEKIKAYILGESTQPLVLHGPSGIGKTSIMAMAASKVKEWTDGKAALIMRFIGTTLDSSHIFPFLKSILVQLKHAQGTYAFAPEDMKGLLWELNQSLNPIQKSCPVVFMFDSLDQFDTADDARQLFWLPQKCPPNIKIIVSTIGDPIYECLPKLKGKFPEENYIEIPPLNISEADNILRTWFMNRNRTVTDEQFAYLVQSFRKQPLALYLKLAFDEARRWTSYSPVDSVKLEKTVRESILKLFDYLEQSHGKIFIAHALGYLTLAQNGLSEAELDDILSCDDDVLNDVYIYWTPPIRRLPPLLLVRLRSYLMNKQYLVERGSDGVIVFNWYHRQFVEAAQERYCSDPNTVSKLHNVLAEFFSGTWANGVKKPFIDNKGVHGEDDRRVASQPIKYGDDYNKRKLNNLPYHRIKAGHAEILKDECLFNYEFLLAKINATSLRRVHSDFDLARSVFPEDKSIAELAQVLRLSEKALVIDPFSLAGQVISRLGDGKEATSIKNQCFQSSHPFIVSNTDVMAKPGGNLKYVLTGHEATIEAISMTKDGKEVATVSYDNTLRTWDIQNGTEIKKIGGLGQRLDGVDYLDGDQAILVKSGTHLTSVTRTGDKIYTVPILSSNQKESACYCVCGPQENTFVRLFADHVSVHAAATGKPETSLDLPDKMTVSNREGTHISLFRFRPHHTHLSLYLYLRNTNILINRNSNSAVFCCLKSIDACISLVHYMYF
ncbi:hypothetical protein FSP39_018264 [Pinctada imbricata]|uniref:Uncharacterized protein n=1 Tax=Pinctada imbricata TaxID=66713 RepID=A0AA89CB61_PINIB|nr:hypothetical protein FSP39_018264 [Pinctada imbricata]